MVRYRNTHDGSVLEQECRNERLEASGRYELVEQARPSGESESEAPAEDKTKKEH